MKKLLIFLSILLATSVSAEEQSYFKQKWMGVNTRVNPKLLQEDEAVTASNITLDETGAFRDRDVFGQYNSSSGALGSNYITGLFKYYTPTSKYFIACAGSNVGLGSGGVWTDISPTTNTVTTGTFWSAVTFNNYEYMFNPSVPMMKYTGTGKLFPPATTPASNCHFSQVHKNRVWASRSDLYPYRTYYSSIVNPDDWNSSGGYIDLPDVAQAITGIVSWAGYMYIFTETTIYVLQGSTPNDFTLRKTNSQVGAIAPRTIKITDDGILFLSRWGVYAFNGNNVVKLSDKIEPNILAISNTQIQNSCAVYDGSKYWLSYTPQGGSYNSKILIYDLMLKEWYFYDNLNISYFERAFGGTDKGELYGGSSTTNGIVYQLQSSSGTESISHVTQSDFSNGTTSNTVVSTTPNVELLNGIDSYTKLDLHCNGVDGATTFQDSSLYNHAITANNSAQVDTAQYKFGGASYLSPGGNDYLWTTDSDDWTFGSDNFTIDFWVRFNSITGSQTLMNHYQSGVNYWTIEKNTSNSLSIYSYEGGVENMGYSYAWTTVANNTWYHLAFVRNGASIKIYKNGVDVNATQDVAIGTLTNFTGNLYMGVYGTLASGQLNGWMDEIRITKGIARWTSNFTIPDAEYDRFCSGGTLTSQNNQINALGAPSLDRIVWTGTYPTNTKATFQTRTGVTNDSVYFNGWQYWSSANTVTLSTVTSNTSMFKPSGNITVERPTIAQRRNELFYEDEDNVSPNCMQFKVLGAVSKGAYADGFLTYTDLSNYDWVTVWYKSPQTGNTVEFSMSNEYNLLSNNYVTFNTVTSSTVSGWFKGYWYIGNIPSGERNGIRYIRVKYTGDASGYIYLGDVKAQNFYNSNDLMTSTPNDWLQYRAIEGSNSVNFTPYISTVTLTYTPGLTVSESSLSSSYKTKWLDFGSPQVSKQFTDLFVDVYTEGDRGAFTLSYDIDNGSKTGSFTFPSTSTVTNNTVNLRKFFPSSTYGKAIQLSYSNTDKDSQHTIRSAEIRYKAEHLR